MPYIGQLAEIPAGKGTLVSDNNPNRSRHFDLIVAEGIVSERGLWEKEPGAALYQTLPVAPNALHDYWPTNSLQRLLALGADGKVYRSTGGAFTALTMATTMAEDVGQILSCGPFGPTQLLPLADSVRKAIVFDNGHSRIQVISADGVVTTDLGGWNTSTNIPTDWATSFPRSGTFHKERLWCVAPANFPHNIYASALGTPENFKNAVGGAFEYVQAIMAGVGQRLVTCVSFKGMLFAFKFPRGIAFLDDTDVDFLNWRWNPVTDAVGCADSPHSVIVMDDDVLFISPDGHLQFLSAVTQQGVSSGDLTAAMNLQQWTRDHINLSRLNRLASVWFPAKKVAMVGVSSSTSTTNDLRLFLDVSGAEQEGESVRLSYSYRDDNRAMTVRRDSTLSGTQKPILGETNGKVWQMDQDVKTKVGVPNASQARFQYVRTDFGHMGTEFSNRRKLFDALTVSFIPTGKWNLGVDTIIDGDYHETLYFSMGHNAATFPLTFPITFAGSVETIRHRMTGNGYWLSLAGYVSGEGQDFAITEFIVNIRPGGEEQR